MNAKVLLLAGTTEATELAAMLAAEGIDVISSLAGGRAEPTVRAGRLRMGGFGGTDGLAGFLRDESIDLVVDATHPFAAVMPFNAFEAAQRIGLPYVRLLREPWRAQPGDRWVEVPDLDTAAAAVAESGQRVFLAVGRRSLGPFARCIGQWFLVRAAEPVTATLPNSLAIRDSGPFGFERELELLREHFVDVVVTKNAGGQTTIAKLEAARALGLTVVMVQRPPGPSGAYTVSSAADAAAWVRRQLESAPS